MELNDLHQISLTAGKPDKNMTDDEWQQYFSAMKLLTTQSKQKYMKSTFPEMIVNGQVEQSTYCGDTEYMYYCEFINSVLSAIRGNSSEPPQHDYCFFIYQIADLLRYEHDRLIVCYKPEYRCFEVWLNI